MTNALAGKQPLDATLTALAGVNTSANQLIYSTATDQFATTPLSAFIRSLLDDGDAAAARATLGAAQASHGHSIAEISGLAAALNAAYGLAQGSTGQDPNLAADHVILSNHANTPDPTYFWHITTTFYVAVAATSNRAQLAIQYNGGNAVYARSFYGSQWTAWARLDNGVPPGSIIYVARSTPPVGYIKANGAAVGRVAYAGLFAQIGTTFGGGDGSTTFNVPDLRGEFIRGLDDGRGMDPSRVLGSIQAGQNLSHTHTGSAAAAGAHTHTISGTALTAGEHTHTAPRAQNNDVGGGSPNFTTANLLNGTTAPTHAAGAHTHSISGTAAAAGDHTHVVTIAANGGNEARPRNMALLACIKY
ncbi:MULTISPECIES: phage tail protein [Pseudomonas]|nr:MULTISPECIES: phage tail protein [Pseudomonas]MDM9592849.1 tail fiber protein [Pseudomonas guariconensis]MDM9605676.1 tail fiber protein [Pseudomonas guariconensis]MDM9610633.1 tail fiber protein [Pseudomonas guariconensis]TYO70668.1 tail fiber protein [Pseudomonas sp. CK-NBRI-02]